MKKDTLHKHIQIANDIMFYIYTHIETNINLDELSEDLHVSKFHMHRIFKESFNKNIYESIKSIRLQKASNLLLTNKHSTITEVAMMCGYSSQTAFIRVFKERFHMTPKEWRRGGYKEYSKKILEQSNIVYNKNNSFETIEPEIVKMPTLKCYYIRHKGYGKSIKKTWQKLHTWILNNNVTSYVQLGLYHDNPAITPPDSCQYIACVMIDEEIDIKSDSLPQFQIASGVYAKFDFSGVYGDVIQFIHWVYHEWLIKSGYETTVKPPYAVYHKNHFLSDDGRFDISFYVPVSY